MCAGLPGYTKNDAQLYDIHWLTYSMCFADMAAYNQMVSLVNSQYKQLFS